MRKIKCNVIMFIKPYLNCQTNPPPPGSGVQPLFIARKSNFIVKMFIIPIS